MHNANADEISERVFALVAQETGWNRMAISPTSEIEGDLGCTGDDALELLLKMEREFGIDMSGVEFDRHFSDEHPGWPSIVALVAAFPISIFVLFVIGLAGRWSGFADRGFIQSDRLFFLTYVPCFLLMAYLTRYLPSERARRKPMVPVTVGHLIEAARSSKWPFTSSGGADNG